MDLKISELKYYLQICLRRQFLYVDFRIIIEQNPRFNKVKLKNVKMY